MAIGLSKTKIGRQIGIFTAVCALAGLIELFMPLSLYLSAFQAKLDRKSVSGDVVVVGVDRDSVRSIGRWPWPRNIQADVLRKIDEANPKAVFVDFDYIGKTTPEADQALGEAYRTMRAPLYTNVVTREGMNSDSHNEKSETSIIGDTPLVSPHTAPIFGQLWHVQFSEKTAYGIVPSMSAQIANITGPVGATFRLDLRYDPSTVTVISAKQLLSGSVNPQKLSGKSVIFAITDYEIDMDGLAGWGQYPGVYYHVIAANTLRDGIPATLGWIYFFLFAAAIALANLSAWVLHRSGRIAIVSMAAILAASTYFGVNNIENNPFPALALLASTAVYLRRQKNSLIRAQRNGQTGFSDMRGYLIEDVVSNCIIVAAVPRIANTMRGPSSLASRPDIIGEIGRRLLTVVDEQQITHDNDGRFLWEMPAIPTQMLAHHLEALRLLFAQPLQIGPEKIDIDIHFGVDRNSTDYVKNRTSKALQAAETASFNDSSFEISSASSFVSNLAQNFEDEFNHAVTNGDISLTLLPRRRLSDDTVQSAVIGLAWVHPTLGELTLQSVADLARSSSAPRLPQRWLCSQAGKVAAELLDQDRQFRISIEICCADLKDPEIAEALYSGIPWGITLQVRDSHALASDPELQTIVKALQTRGYSLAIANFGSTHNDLELIPTLTPDEIILLQSFASGLVGSTSNGIYVDAALRIARTSGVLCVAENLEDREVFHELQRRGCDLAQGKIIGSPLNLDVFFDTYLNSKERQSG
jgi:EAL domain-containing protein (putative c-di-GMP-specific phosphodiesterase class I)/CHASE2 domain-containing sensor protein